MKFIRVMLCLVVFMMLFAVGCTSSSHAEVVVKAKPITEPASSAIKSAPLEKVSSVVIEPKVSAAADVPIVSPQPSPQSSLKTFSLVAKQWAFEPGMITVKKGDKVHLTLTSKDVAHGFRIQEYGIDEKINPGKKIEIDFVADKVGTFSFFCSVPCGKGHTGMSGKLVVEE